MQVFHNNHKDLMIFSCHHKVGTSWFNSVLSHIAKEFELSYQYCNKLEINADTDIFLDDHSRLDLSQLKDYRGVHLIRDPRDVVVSGFHYHKWTQEHWANVPNKLWDGLTYKEKINSLDDKEALLFEMENTSKYTIFEMMEWHYDNENYLEITFERLLEEQAEVFLEIFQHYNFSDAAVDRCLKIADNYKFDKMKARTKSQHLRKGVSGDWINYFDRDVKETFKCIFPNVLQKLGYEKDDNW